jgi:hypothetical protein
MVANKYFEIVAVKLKYLETTATNQNYVMRS